MKLLSFLVFIFSLNRIGCAQFLGIPIFNPLDPRFEDWQPAGPDDCK
jgi:hypothetical protein